MPQQLALLQFPNRSIKMSIEYLYKSLRECMRNNKELYGVIADCRMVDISKARGENGECVNNAYNLNKDLRIMAGFTVTVVNKIVLFQAHFWNITDSGEWIDDTSMFGFTKKILVSVYHPISSRLHDMYELDKYGNKKEAGFPPTFFLRINGDTTNPYKEVNCSLQYSNRHNYVLFSNALNFKAVKHVTGRYNGVNFIMALPIHSTFTTELLKKHFVSENAIVDFDNSNFSVYDSKEFRTRVINTMSYT